MHENSRYHEKQWDGPKISVKYVAQCVLHIVGKVTLKLGLKKKESFFRELAKKEIREAMKINLKEAA